MSNAIEESSTINTEKWPLDLAHEGHGYARPARFQWRGGNKNLVGMHYRESRRERIGGRQVFLRSFSLSICRDMEWSLDRWVKG